MSPPRSGDGLQQLRDDVSDVESEQGQPISLVTLSLTKADRDRDITKTADTVRSTQAHQSSTNRIQRIRRCEWLWEFCSCVLILVALGTLIGILHKAQAQPLPLWRRNHHDVSINAVVAVLSTVLKGASVFIVAEGLLLSQHPLASPDEHR